MRRRLRRAAHVPSCGLCLNVIPMGDHRSVAVVTVTSVLISSKKPLKIQGQFLDLDLIVEMARWANLKSKLTEYGTRYHKILVYRVMTLRKGVPQKMLTLPRSGNLATSLHNRLGLIEWVIKISFASKYFR